MPSSAPSLRPANQRASLSSLPSSPTPTTTIRPEGGSRVTCAVTTCCVLCIGLTLIIFEVLFNLTHMAFLNTVVPDNLTIAEQTTTPFVQHAPPRALLDSLPLADGTLLWNFLSDDPVVNITSTIYCMYDPIRANRDVVYRLHNIPLPLCTAVVFCCAGISPSNYSLRFYEEPAEDDEPQSVLAYFSEFLSLRLYRKSEYKLLIAIGGPPNRYRELAETLPASSEIMRNLYRDALEFGVDGIMLYIMYPELFPLPQLLNVFLESHRGYHYHVMVFLPRNPEMHAKYFNVTSLLQNEFIHFVQVSHPLVSGTDYVTCPNPKWAPNNATSMKALQKELLQQYSSVWGKLSSRLLYTVSFLGYSYLAQDPEATNGTATLLDNVTYTEACAAVKSRKWKGTYDHDKNCFVASKGGLFMATPAPESFAFLDEDFTGSGVVVFDMFSDDFRGVCGIKSPLSQAVRNAFVNRTLRESRVLDAPLVMDIKR